MANLQASISLNPYTEYRLRDEIARNGNRITTIDVGDLTIHLSAWRGDAELIATTGILIDLLERVRTGARQRIAAESTGLPALPDALEPATLADALAGWTEADKAAAWGR